MATICLYNGHCLFKVAIVTKLVAMVTERFPGSLWKPFFILISSGRRKMSAFQHVSHILRIPVSWLKKINRNLKIRSYFYHYKMMKKTHPYLSGIFFNHARFVWKMLSTDLAGISPNKLKLKQFSYVITGTMYILL